MILESNTKFCLSGIFWKQNYFLFLVTTANFNQQVRTNKLVYNSYFRSDFKFLQESKSFTEHPVTNTTKYEKKTIENMKEKIRRYFTEKVCE